MTESDVEAAFRVGLERDGWSVSTERVAHVDLVATRGDETLYAEVKGHTKSPGTAVDIGQLLRRMVPEPAGSVRYAFVVPESLRWHASRVAATARRQCGIELYVVARDGTVTTVDD